MPEIEVRPAISSDIPSLINMDHGYTTEFVWQMEVTSDTDRIGIGFREIRLPRLVHVDYPHIPAMLADNWTKRDGLFVALLEDIQVGYISLMFNHGLETIRVSDLVVTNPMRRKGIASVLLIAAQDWGAQQRMKRINLEMQPKNYPAIQLAKKMSFDFCGYNDRYYANQDIALFFTHPLR